MNTEKVVPLAATFSIDLGKPHVEILWGLLSAQGVGTPFAQAKAAGELFAMVRAAAVLHGVIPS